MFSDLPVDNKWGELGMESPIIKIFEKVLPLSDDIKAILNRDTYFLKVSKNRFVISPIDRNRNLYLIVKGVVRGFVKDEDREITTWISQENDIVGTIKNLWMQEESDEYIQALEDVELVCLPHVMSEYLYANYGEANFVGRVIMERYYQSAQERAFICRLSSAEKRYKKFLEMYGSLINRIPLKYIASFLSIRLETLSRIRTQIAGNNI